MFDAVTEKGVKRECPKLKAMADSIARFNKLTMVTAEEAIEGIRAAAKASRKWCDFDPKAEASAC